MNTNTVTWNGVPIDAPGTSGVRVMRITNVRANANQLGLSSSLSNPNMIVGFIQTPLSSGITIVNPQQTLGSIQPGLLIGAESGSFQQCPGFNGSQLFSETTPGVPGPAKFNLRFQESFPGAFKQRALIPRNVPGQSNFGSESGFVPNPSAGLPANTGAADSGTILHGTLENVPTGLKAMVPAQIPMLNFSGANSGIITTFPTGAVSGSNIIFTPDSNGMIDFFLQVAQRSGTNPLTVTLPVTLTGSSSLVPSNIQGLIAFPNSQFPETTLFAPGSDLVNPYPIFGPLDAGVAKPAINPYLTVASIVPCTNSGFSLKTDGTAAPNFIGATGNSTPGGTVQALDVPAGATLAAPRVSNVGIVSALLATPNVTVSKDPSATWLNVGLSQSTTPLTAFISVNPTGPGNYSTTLRFSAPSVPGAVSVPVSYTVAPGPWFTRYGFGSSASYVNNVVAPGEPFIIFGGDDFGPAQLAPPALGPDGRAVSTLGDTQVLFDGVPASLYYSVDAGGTGRVAGFAPFALDVKSETNVQVVYKGVASPPVTLFVLDAVPGLYTADSSGGGQGSILNQDSSVNGPANPEAPGNVVVLYGGGAGQTDPAGRDGALAGVGGPIAQLKLPVKVFIDGIQATDIQYAGPAPGLVEGVFQINVRIPGDARHNANVPVLVQIGDKQTQPGVTLATK